MFGYRHSDPCSTGFGQLHPRSQGNPLPGTIYSTSLCLVTATPQHLMCHLQDLDSCIHGARASRRWAPSTAAACSPGAPRRATSSCCATLGAPPTAQLCHRTRMTSSSRQGTRYCALLGAATLHVLAMVGALGANHLAMVGRCSMPCRSDMRRCSGCLSGLHPHSLGAPHGGHS
jgi:hypothetical protein